MNLRPPDKWIPRRPGDSLVSRERLRYFFLLLLCSAGILFTLTVIDFATGRFFVAGWLAAATVLTGVATRLVTARRDTLAYFVAIVGVSWCVHVPMLVDIVHDVSSAPFGEPLLPYTMFAIAVAGFLATSPKRLGVAIGLNLVAVFASWVLRFVELQVSAVSLITHGFLAFAMVAASVSLYLVLEFADRSQRREKRLVQDRDVLLHELNHRVKNNLQIVSSLLRLETNRTVDAATMEVLTKSRGRINAMALVHRMFSDSAELGYVVVPRFLRLLVQQIMSTLGIAGGDVKVIVDTPELRAAADTLVPLGLVANELLSSAYYMGVLERDNPGITLRICDDNVRGRYRFALCCNVRKPSERVDSTDRTDSTDVDSLSLSIIQALVDQLRGEFRLTRWKCRTETSRERASRNGEDPGDTCPERSSEQLLCASISIHSDRFTHGEAAVPGIPRS